MLPNCVLFASLSYDHLSYNSALHQLPLKGNTDPFWILKFSSDPWNAAPGTKLELSSSLKEKLKEKEVLASFSSIWVDNW